MSPSKVQVILARDSRVGQSRPFPHQLGSIVFLACPPTFPLQLPTSVCSGICWHDLMLSPVGYKTPLSFHIVGTAFFLTLCEEASLWSLFPWWVVVFCLWGVWFLSRILVLPEAWKPHLIIGAGRWVFCLQLQSQDKAGNGWKLHIPLTPWT